MRKLITVFVVGVVGVWAFAGHAQQLASKGVDVKLLNQPNQLVTLGEALSKLEEAYNVHIVYDDSVVRGRTAPLLVSASQKFQKALETVLGESPITYKKVGARTVVLQPFEPAPPTPAKPPGGTIKGAVTDETGEGIPLAQVFLEGTTIGDAADNKGAYEITNVPSGTYTLRTRVIGYKSETAKVTVSEDETVTQDFTLALDILSMEEVVTTATRTGRVQKEATTSMAVVPAKRIEQFKPQSVAEVLRTIPGIYAEEGGGEVAVNSFVRGLPAPGQFRYQTLQEDGIPVRTVPGGFISAEDVFFRHDLNVRTLEVAKGGASTLFGINAPGGIINYISKTGGNVMRTNLRFTGAERNYYRADFNTNGPLGDDYRFNIGGFYRFDEGPRISGLPTQGLQIKGNVTRLLDTGHLRLYFKYMDDRVQFLLPFAHNSQTLEPAIESDGTHNSAEAADFTVPTPGGTFESTMDRGVMTKGGSVMFEYYNEWGDGWSIENKTRWMDFEHEFNIFIPFVAAFRDAFAEQFKENPNDRAVYSFTNRPQQAFNADAVMQQGLWARFRPTEELANQFSLQKRLETENSRHVFSFGAYLSRTEVTDKQIRTTGLFEMANEPRMVDLKIIGVDGDTTEITRNGISEVSNNFFNREFGSNTVAV
ncbi:TonB-dependent receptor plug domain-containing protein, partial [candidate division KSB1 bacterium]|nr:TonB-dependent receptor plug domain-containing protein [candidate division KSB1 bacterium]NIR70163.1 TonB-dependent receptor plug domain-containing protein [candidate division KSB1 bacterium]NIS27549.1 TonB-dependent receptor plug domain-containing protein [candidate division KSB1 bacterium]NIT74402.1 TonB-dependent receptor plug domain-containing protein [candidate division KSB1 bacterium]NIU28267.1 TonB-dependent receptor plug domain-containing protein [candidate division KSB1 bacterium]